MMWLVNHPHLVFVVLLGGLWAVCRNADDDDDDGSGNTASGPFDTFTRRHV